MPKTVLQELCEPWAIDRAPLRVLRDQIQAAIDKAIQAHDATPIEDTHNVTMRGDVAILHIKGPMFRYHSWLTRYMGTSSYGELRKDLQKLVDAKVRALLVIVDSPGGEVNGLIEMADALFDARSAIPFRQVYAAGTCASAAYVLASAVGKISCAPTAIVGSLGVIRSMIDDSKAMADLGLKEYEFTNKQSPNKSQQLSDAEFRARIQAQCDELGNVLIERVSAYRGVTTASVQKDYGQGGCFVGQGAVDAGVADEISDVETVIASLQAKVSKATATPQRSIFQPSSMGASSHGIDDDGAAARAGGNRQREAGRGEGARVVGVPGGRAGGDRRNGRRGSR
jgi:ClpP class serine protease